MRLPKLLFLTFIMFGIASTSGQTVGKPKKDALQATQTLPCAPVAAPSPQADSKASTEEVLEMAHTAVENAESYIHYVGLIGAILALFLGYVGVTNIIDARRNKDEMMRIEGELRKLEDSRKHFERELEKLENGKKTIEDDLERDKKAIEAAREEDKKAIEAAREEFRLQREDITKNISGLRDQQKSLWESSETVRKGLAELTEQERSLRKLTETVQKVTLGRSRLSAETRLKALQQLSQLVDPLGIPPLLEVLTDRNNDLKLRHEAAYGLGRYSENPAFREYYPEIFSGFREILENHENPQTLALETIKSARLFGPDPGGLAPLYEKWGIE